jgi:hypothetical protein
MHRWKIAAIVVGLLWGPIASPGAQAVSFRGDLQVGYRDGVGFAGAMTVAGLTPDLPLQFRLGLGFASLNPGKADEAREIFINNATNGTPEKSGRVWDTSFDFALPLTASASSRLSLLTGPRHARFTGNFKYIGGNEDFDVTCNQWGWGVGLESALRMSTRTVLLLGGGAEYYFGGTLKGHDTSYSPDDENVNPREDFTYDDADEAINQPTVRVQLMAGVGVRFD